MEKINQMSAYEQYVNQKTKFRYYLGLVRRWMNHRHYEKIANIARKRGAKVGEYVCMPKAFAMKCNKRVEIGSHVVIETSDLSLGQWSLKIGSHVIIGRDVRLYLNGHDVHNTEFPFHRRHPEGLVIEDYAWVCPGVCVLPSVDRIGMGGVINTCSVVYEDVAPMGIYGGNPAQRIGTRRAVHSDLPVESHQNNDLEAYIKARKVKR